METTDWDAYGTQSGNPQCANCMVHCGYEPTSVDDTFGSVRGFVDTVKATFSLYPDKDALADLDHPVRAVIEKAFDYRGDITVTRKDGSQISGYLFDRRIGKTLGDSFIRLMLENSSDRPAIPYGEIANIAFSGRDTAAGKSYEAWVKKYWEKRAAGEKNISIEPEELG